MIQEYLLLENTEKDAVKKYDWNGMTARLFSIENSEYWYAQFSVEGENEESAKKLSKVDEHFQQRFHVTVLESGCSAYFNKRLYPLISEFEYKLRKLLYLASAINRDDKATENIRELEEKDWGQIFSILFIDNSFVKRIKDEIKRQNVDTFSKENIVALVKSVEEKPLWDSLLGKDIVPTLRLRFNDVRTFRNDVMHSHYINWENFKKASELYCAINKELDEAILRVTGKENKLPGIYAFNQTLARAMKEQLQFRELPGLYAVGPELAEQLQKTGKIIEKISIPSEVLQKISEVAKLYEVKPELSALIEKIQILEKSIPELKKTPEY